jgi:DNA-binding NarL/FixJ family response regulator
MPDLLRDIVANAVSTEPDIEIAAEARSVEELERFVDTQHPDLVIAAERDFAFARASRRLLNARALPPFLLLTDDGNAAYLHWTRPETSSLGQLTPEGLVREIRAATLLDSQWRNAN